MTRAGRLRHLASLLRPYRARVALMFVALLLATGAALAPPYLAGRAIDDGIRDKDVNALTIIAPSRTSASSSSSTSSGCRSAFTRATRPAC